MMSGAQPPRVARSSKAKAKAEAESMYELDMASKANCLRNMERLQWNHQIVSQMSNEDVTEAWQFFSSFLSFLNLLG